MCERRRIGEPSGRVNGVHVGASVGVGRRASIDGSEYQFMPVAVLDGRRVHWHGRNTVALRSQGLLLKKQRRGHKWYQRGTVLSAPMGLHREMSILTGGCN